MSVIFYAKHILRTSIKVSLNCSSRCERHLSTLPSSWMSTASLITLEDILEEIVGEIRDEYDENEEEFLKEITREEFVVEGSMNLDDLNDRLDLDLSSEDYDSLGGFIIEQLDRLPEKGDEITTENGIRMVVDSLDKNRVEKVHIYLPKDFYDKKDSDDNNEE